MNYDLNVKTVEIKPFRKDMFYDLLAIDSDFSENEDMYRKDTLELGFQNEADRISQELSQEFEKEWDGDEDFQDDESFMVLIEKYIEKAVHSSVNGSTHVIGNESFTSKYVITPIFNYDESIDYGNPISVVLSYMSY